MERLFHVVPSRRMSYLPATSARAGNHQLQAVSAQYLPGECTKRNIGAIRHADIPLDHYLISPEMKIFEPLFRLESVLGDNEVSLRPAERRWVESPRPWSGQTLDLALAFGASSPHGITVPADVFSTIDTALALLTLYRKELSAQQQHPVNTYETARKARLSVQAANVLLSSHPQPHLTAHWHRLIATRIVTRPHRHQHGKAALDR